jgi:hypothetical protein
VVKNIKQTILYARPPRRKELHAGQNHMRDFRDFLYKNLPKRGKDNHFYTQELSKWFDWLKFFVRRFVK